MAKNKSRIEEHPSVKGLRWRPTGLTEAEQKEHESILQAQRKEDAELEAVATESLAKKTAKKN